MHKEWCIFLVLLVLTACGGGGSESTDKNSPPVEPVTKETNSTVVSGIIALGPVISSHNLQLVLYGDDLKQLAAPKVNSDGSYEVVLSDHKGLLIAKLTDGDVDAPDYMDEALGEHKSLGNNTLLSAMTIDSEAQSRVDLHITPLTTVAARHAGIKVDSDGTLFSSATEESVTKSNQVVTDAFGLVDSNTEKTITNLKPTPIITSSNESQKGNRYGEVLAAISGAEQVLAKGKEQFANKSDYNLTSVQEFLLDRINIIGSEAELDGDAQDLIVMGMQVALEVNEQLILADSSEFQSRFSEAIIIIVNAKTLPPAPIFIATNTQTKDSNLKWEWLTGGNGSGPYRYYFSGQEQRAWILTDSTEFIVDFSVEPGEYRLYVQESNASGQWGTAAVSIIEVLPWYLLQELVPF